MKRTRKSEGRFGQKGGNDSLASSKTETGGTGAAVNLPSHPGLQPAKPAATFPHHHRRWFLAAHSSAAIVAGLAIAAVGRSAAQTASPAEDPRDKTIRELLLRVEALEKDAKIRREADGTEPSQPMAGVKNGESPERFPQMQFNGFSDLELRLTDRKGERQSFTMGQLDLFFTSHLAENVSVLGELVAEAGDDNAFKFEVERILLQYELSEYLEIEAGRYHTEIGYYNTQYHHGSWLQTAARRPLIDEFEDDGGVLPLHNVGFSIHGLIPSGQLGLSYVVQVGNGRNYSDGAQPVLSVADDNDYKAVGVTLKARPEWAPNWQAGATFYHDRLTPEGLPATHQYIAAGHLVYVTPEFEFLSEAFWIRHQPSRGGSATHATALYGQVARQLGSFRPYLRYQYQNASEHDPILNGQGMKGWLHGPSIGVRYDFARRAALKLEYDHFMPEASRAINEVTFQISYGF